jgi:hypothetical protein
VAKNRLLCPLQPFPAERMRAWLLDPPLDVANTTIATSYNPILRIKRRMSATPANIGSSIWPHVRSTLIALTDAWLADHVHPCSAKNDKHAASPRPISLA